LEATHPLYLKTEGSLGWECSPGDLGQGKEKAKTVKGGPKLSPPGRGIGGKDPERELNNNR